MTLRTSSNGEKWKAVSELFERAGRHNDRDAFLQSIIAGLYDIVPCDAGYGLLEADGSLSRSVGLRDREVRAYNEHYRFKLDFLPNSFHEISRRGTRMEDSPVIWKRYPETEFIVDFCRRLGLGSTLTYFPAGGSCSLVSHRGVGTKAHSEEEKEAFRAINVTMNHFLRLFRRADCLGESPDPADIKARFPRISPREAQVAHETCLGLSAALIARRAGVSRRTVESQLESLYRKTGVRAKGELIEILRSPDHAGRHR